MYWHDVIGFSQARLPRLRLRVRSGNIYLLSFILFESDLVYTSPLNCTDRFSVPLRLSHLVCMATDLRCVCLSLVPVCQSCPFFFSCVRASPLKCVALSCACLSKLPVIFLVRVRSGARTLRRAFCACFYRSHLFYCSCACAIWFAPLTWPPIEIFTGFWKNKKDTRETVIEQISLSPQTNPTNTCIDNSSF